MESYPEILRRASISFKDFRNNHVIDNKPIVLTKMMNSWKSMKKWDFDFFEAIGSGVEVTTEVGNVMQETTEFETIDFGTYVKEIKEATVINSKGLNRKYLSMLELFSIFPDLKDDVDFDLIASLKTKLEYMAWLGPANTVTGFHMDWSDNLFAQIRGRKLFLLVSPDYDSCMYASRKYDPGTTLSLVSFDNYSPDDFPLFGRVQIIKTILEPGEMLFIPKGWWHYVKALDLSISVNCFGKDRWEIIKSEPVKLLYSLLHFARLYGKECTCHKYYKGKRIKR